MKYSVGQKVKITENVLATKYMHDFLNSLDPPYILTINSIVRDHYYKDQFYKMMEDECFLWSDKYIECIYSKRDNPISSRFELLDL